MNGCARLPPAFFIGALPQSGGGECEWKSAFLGWVAWPGLDDDSKPPGPTAINDRKKVEGSMPRETLSKGRSAFGMQLLQNENYESKSIVG
jgi:hypothetical protein